MEVVGDAGDPQGGPWLSWPPEWGPIVSPQRMTARPTLGRMIPQTSLECPRCGSSATKTLSMIRAQGTTTGSGTATGWVQGTGTNPGHSVTVTTRTTSYTEAAQNAAPPQKRYNGSALIVSGMIVGAVAVWIGLWVGSENAPLVAGLIVVLGVLAAAAMAISGVVLAPRDAEFNRHVFPEAMARWSRSWQCQRCGTRFVV